MIRLRQLVLSVSLLTATTWVAALASPGAQIPPPPVRVTGWLATSESQMLQLRSDRETYMVVEGDKLGDYQVKSIQAGKATFAYHAHQWRLAMLEPFTGVTKNVEEAAPTEPEKAFPRPSTFVMEFSHADLVYALKMVARTSHVDIAVGPAVDGEVNLRGSFNSGSALQALLEGRHLSWIVRDGMLIVAPEGKLSERLPLANANAKQLEGVNGAKLLSLDFVNADLAYVCELCSKEMQANNVAPLPDGSVTCTLHSRSTASALGLLLALQENPVTVTVEGARLSYTQAAVPKH